MIVVTNGEKQTVNTTSKAIDVLFYFQPQEKALTASQFIIDEEYQGSMRDKGKDLIEQAREVQLKNSAEQLDKVLSSYNSTRHKIRQGYPLNMESGVTFPHPFTNALSLETCFNSEKFREDKLSEANQERQKELSRGLVEQKVFKKLEIRPEDIKRAMDDYEPFKGNDKFKPFEGKKETLGKTDYSEINLGILDLMAERFSANKDKYEKGNSKKPLDKQQILWALFRHVKKMVQPIEGDEENFTQHLAACLTNCSILLDQLEIEK